MSKQKTVLLGVTSSIAAYRALDLISLLKKESIRVLPVLSKDAHHFVTPLSLQSMAGEPVRQNMMAPEENTTPIHIELAREADLIVICPASADILARMRSGAADDLLACTLLAAQSPVMAVPAMNDKMLEHPATQENLQVLRDRGIQIIDPVEGKLVCSDHAMGHIAPNDVILQKILSLLKL